MEIKQETTVDGLDKTTISGQIGLDQHINIVCQKQHSIVDGMYTIEYITQQGKFTHKEEIMYCNDTMQSHMTITVSDGATNKVKKDYLNGKMICISKANINRFGDLSLTKRKVKS